MGRAQENDLSQSLASFVRCESGAIKINGVNIAEVTQHNLRGRGLCRKKRYCFLVPFIENMKYGKPDASDEEIWQALEIAQAKDFVSELADGLDSRRTSGGNFSGGQRQRLAIARALVKQADVYVFDDSFSALDFKTDANLRAALKRDMQDSIMVVVAQRSAPSWMPIRS